MRSSSDRWDLVPLGVTQRLEPERCLRLAGPKHPSLVTNVVSSPSNGDLSRFSALSQIAAEPGVFPPDEVEALLGRSSKHALMERRFALARAALELVLDILKVPDNELAPDVEVTLTGSARGRLHS